MSELLASGPFTDEERAVHDAPPRPGWCWHLMRRLSQDETDVRIRRSLLAIVDADERAELARLVGPIPTPGLGERTPMQYGGLDSDPLLRVLTLRAWGRRDLLFSFERGIRRDDLVQLIAGAEPLVACAQLHNPVLGTALGDAGPGAWLEVAVVDALRYDASASRARVVGRARRGEVIRAYRVADVPRGGPPPAYGVGSPVPRV